MQLKDLIGRSAKDLTDEELEYKINMMKKLKVRGDVASAPNDGEDNDEDNGMGLCKPKRKPRIKSNKERKTKSLIDSLDAEELEMLKQMMGKK